MPVEDLHRVRFEILKGFCTEVYARTGVPLEQAEIAADLLARSDLRGYETHGVTRLPIYITRLKKGYVRAECTLTTLNERGPLGFLAANGSMGHVVAYKAMQMAIRKAEEYGIGWVSVRDSGHFGVAGLFSMMAISNDFIGYVVSNSAPVMAPYGGSERIIGNNPLSYAFPAEEFPPVVLDFSCGIVSAGEILLRQKRGEKLPWGWAFDKEGIPTQDPYEAFEGGGSIAPMGGHKGYGLTLVHEMLTAVLTGGKWSQQIKNLYEEDKTGIQGTCHSFMAIDPEFFIGRAQFKKKMDEYIRSIKSSRGRDSKPILMPGERAYKTERERSKDGIPLSPNTAAELTNLGHSLGIALEFIE